MENADRSDPAYPNTTCFAVATYACMIEAALQIADVARTIP